MSSNLDSLECPYTFVTDEVRAVALKLLNKDPAMRYQNVDEIVHDIAQVKDQFSKNFAILESLPAAAIHHIGMLNREGPMERLENCITAVLSGESDRYLMNVVAPQGVGKTTLLNEVMIVARSKGHNPVEISFSHDLTPLQANLEHFLLALLYHTDRAEMRTHFSQITDWIEQEADLADFVPEDKIDWFAQLADFVFHILKRERIQVLIFDDLDCASDVEAEFFQYLFRTQSLAEFKCAIVAASASESEFVSISEKQELLRLENFTRIQTLIYVEALLNSTGLDSEVPDRLFDMSKGNPLFIKETLNAFLQKGALRRDHAKWILASEKIENIPSSLEAIVSQKLDGLDSTLRGDLRRISIFPGTFNVRELQVLGLKNVTFEFLYAMMQRDIITRLKDGYSFSSLFLRDKLYNQLNTEDRLQLHGMMAGFLKQNEPLADSEIAYHFVRSDQREQAVPYLARVAQRQEEAFFWKGALESYEKLAGIYAESGQTDGVSETLMRMEEIHDLIGNREAQQKVLEEIETRADNSDSNELKLRALLRRANYLERVSRLDESEEVCRQAIELSESTGGSTLTGQLYRQMGKSYYRRGLWDDALECYLRTKGLAESARDETLEMEVHNSLGTVFGSKGDFGKAATEFQSTLKLARARNQPRSEINALHNLGYLHKRANNPEEALKYFNVAREVLQKYRSRKFDLDNMYYRGVIENEQHHYEQALEHFENAKVIATEIDDMSAQSPCYG